MKSQVWGEKTCFLPGWKTSNCNFVTTLETNSGSALAKKGTAATRDRQLKFITSWKKQRNFNSAYKLNKNDTDFVRAREIRLLEKKTSLWKLWSEDGNSAFYSNK